MYNIDTINVFKVQTDQSCILELPENHQRSNCRIWANRFAHQRGSTEHQYHKTTGIQFKHFSSISITHLEYCRRFPLDQAIEEQGCLGHCGDMVVTICAEISLYGVMKYIWILTCSIDCVLLHWIGS